jgi:hypothetical protein
MKSNLKYLNLNKNNNIIEKKKSLPYKVWCQKYFNHLHLQ